MNIRSSIFAGLLVFAGSTPALAGTRIVWEPGSSSTVLDVIDRESKDSTRLAIHQGRLIAFSPADTRLFAVFLEDESAVARLERRLRGRAVQPMPDLLRDALPGTASFDELKLERNGRLTLFADEAVRPETEWVAVVNGSGEILGSRPLWQGSRELAVLQ